jgi:hypothetical protein
MLYSGAINKGVLCLIAIKVHIPVNRATAYKSGKTMLTPYVMVIDVTLETRAYDTSY